MSPAFLAASNIAKLNSLKISEVVIVVLDRAHGLNETNIRVPE